MKYTLTKMSEPGFSLETDTEGYLERVLSVFICTTCQDEYKPETYDKYLDTPCGEEFLLEIED